MRSERAALDAILLHATEALLFVGDLTVEEFLDDRRTFHAVTRCLEIVSEATRRLSNSLKERHPSVPWRDMADAGNVYRHDYDNVAASFVYKTVTRDLVTIINVVEAELAGG